MDPFADMNAGTEPLDADIAAIFDLPAPAAEPAPVDPVQAPAPPPAAEPAGEVVAPSSPAEPAPAAPSPAAPPAPAAPAAPAALESTPAPAATPPEPAAPADPEAALKARTEASRIELLEAELARLKAAPAAPATPAPPGNDGPPEEARLNLVVPNDVAAAIFDEDQAKAHAGLNHLVTGISTVILTKALQLVDQRIGNLRTEMQTPIQEAEARSEAKKIENKYFELNPAHNKPAIMPILREVSAQMAAEFASSPIDDTYLSAMGARVNRRLAELVGTAPEPTPAPTPPAAPQPATKPAAMVPAAPRPASAGELSLPEEVEAIFSATD